MGRFLVSQINKNREKRLMQYSNNYCDNKCVQKSKAYLKTYFLKPKNLLQWQIHLLIK